MASPTVNYPCGLPKSPRPNKMLLPIDTTIPNPSSQCGYGAPSSAGTCEKTLQPQFVDTRKRNRDSLIFINATIPLSPASSISKEYSDRSSLDSERKRSGLARLFGWCFGGAERRRNRYAEFEEVKSCHWTEL
ncbi:hypothetical protein K469DRAFT_552627 [Zopfia rhizophila CBS 207.26]|uniref:Uncharacterized protein n=1 Tax=Zopfia rhizophila CBS 207.26 TaxID=1314779 RepID=A0A6A6ENY2_9PEZI|nr:hypothetical protein K469DRAFT_552627 [Zopfia rhizophila CBS 207.26]